MNTVPQREFQRRSNGGSALFETREVLIKESILIQVVFLVQYIKLLGVGSWLQLYYL